MGNIIKIDGLKPEPLWATHIGAIKGCANYLGTPLSTPWLYGAVGHAFVLNIHAETCPSGPTAWCSSQIFRLAHNVGLCIDGVCSVRPFASDFGSDQERAFRHIRAAIERGIPCYGWELQIPEFYTIHGVDDVGYYFSGCFAEDGAGPKPWQELGATDIALLEAYSVESCDVVADLTTVRDALSFALKFARDPGDLLLPNYISGVNAFRVWAEALETGSAIKFGHSYNIEVWVECRLMAVEFLREARFRLAGVADKSFEAAINLYRQVCDRLMSARALHPFSPPSNMSERLKCEESAHLLHEAGDLESEALNALERLVYAFER